MDNRTHCAGCGQAFENYGMDHTEGVNIEGSIYCNADCELESGARAIEDRQIAALADDGSTS